jgi:GTPase involved in cell partitioning and DNA repair
MRLLAGSDNFRSGPEKRSAALLTLRMAADIVIGCVGKPSAGKSTFLNAATDANAKIGMNFLILPHLYIFKSFVTLWLIIRRQLPVHDNR